MHLVKVGKLNQRVSNIQIFPCIHHMRAMGCPSQQWNQHSRPWVCFAIKGPARATPSWTSASATSQAMQLEKDGISMFWISKLQCPWKSKREMIRKWDIHYINSIVSWFHAPVKPFETCLIVSHPSHVLTSFTGDCSSKRFHSWIHVAIRATLWQSNQSSPWGWRVDAHSLRHLGAAHKMSKYVKI